MRNLCPLKLLEVKVEAQVLRERKCRQESVSASQSLSRPCPGATGRTSVP